MLGAQPLPQCYESVLLMFCGDYEVAGGWHLRKVKAFLRDENDQTDRKKETEKRMREERLVMQCQFIKYYFRELNSTDSFTISKAEFKIL